MADVIASPSTRALAATLGIDIAQRAEELGRRTIGREDLAPTSPSPSAPAGQAMWDVDHTRYGPTHSVPTSRIAQVAARNLSAANAHIPQVTHHDRAETTAVDALRARWRPQAEARGVKLTALAFHVKVLATCLTRFPHFNASLLADGNTLIYKEYTHIGIAVDTPHGLMVPVLRDVAQKGLWQIASDITDLAAKAQARKLGPDEMGGASMSISNLGGIGGTAFTPIVNPPELAILGVTRSETVTLWDSDVPRPVSMVPLDLSYDHRVINGADAARFLVHYAKLFSDPRWLLV